MYGLIGLIACMHTVQYTTTTKAAVRLVVVLAAGWTHFLWAVPSTRPRCYITLLPPAS